FLTGRQEVARVPQFHELGKPDPVDHPLRMRVAGVGYPRVVELARLPRSDEPEDALDSIVEESIHPLAPPLALVGRLEVIDVGGGVELWDQCHPGFSSVEMVTHRPTGGIS